MNPFSYRVVSGITGFLFVLLTATAGAPSRAEAQFDGRWGLKIRLAPGVFLPTQVTMTQVGNALTFTVFTAPFSGTVTGQTFYATTPTGGGILFPNGGYMRGSLTAHPSRVVAGIVNSPSAPPGFLSLQRCTCFDGNSTDGDGCSGTCQVEPCYECTGDPSVCTPAADGAPCEDGRVCTDGETCLAGACGGGGPVTPCVDLNGRWHLEFESDTGNGSADRVVTQDGSYLEHSGCGGLIDPATGLIDLTCVHVELQGFSDCPFGGRQGNATADGSMFADAYFTFIFLFSEGGCGEFDTFTTATRLCGDGDVQPGDECDDGNVAPGDGCDSNCRIEPCWSCTGDPSSCAPLADGTRCGDGDVCTAGDSCQAGTCAPGTTFQCGACEACGPLGSCIAAPMASCRNTTKPKRTMLTVQNPDASARRDKIIWKLAAAEATAAGELADPLAGADYSLCLFDESASPTKLLARGGAASGDTCGGEPCWERKSDGELVYRNPDNSAGGLSMVRVRPGADGEARVVVRGKGPLGAAAPDLLPQPPLPIPLLVQLQGEGGACFEARFDATSLRTNETRGFSGKATP